MRRALSLATLLAAVGGPAFAQQINRINGIPNTPLFAEDAAALRNGDVAFAGSITFYSPSFLFQPLLTRTAPDGSPLWALTLEISNEFANGFAVRERSTTDLVFGFYSGSNQDSICLAGVSASGTLLWANRYAGVNDYQGGAMELESTRDSDLAWVAGRFSYTPPAGGVILCANAATGAVVSNTAYFPANAFEVSDLSFTDLAFEPGGDIFAIGSATRIINGETFDTDAAVARIDRSTGAVVWCRTYGLPPTPEGIIYDNGRGIELTSDGHVAVAIQTTDPSVQYGPPASLHLLLQAADGQMMGASLLSDVQVANASLDRISNGALLVSGSRTFGDGGSFARMWLLDPSNMNVIWVNEYTSGQTFGTDAIEHFTPEPGFILTGTNVPFSVPPFAYPDHMFIKTDTFGDDGCSTNHWSPDPQPPTVWSFEIEVVSDGIGDATPLIPDPALLELSTALACDAVVCIGDLNGDGFVDDADFVIFVNAYNILDCFDPSMPPGCPADLNMDGVVDDADFVLFVPAYNQLVCE